MRILPILLVLVLLISCGEDKSYEPSEKTIANDNLAVYELKLSDLNEPCKCLEGMNLVVTKVDDILSKYESALELEANIDDKFEFDKLSLIMDEVNEHCIKDLGFVKDEVTKCEGYEKFQETSDRIYNFQF